MNKTSLAARILAGVLAALMIASAVFAAVAFL